MGRSLSLLLLIAMLTPAAAQDGSVSYEELAEAIKRCSEVETDWQATDPHRDPCGEVPLVLAQIAGRSAAAAEACRDIWDRAQQERAATTLAALSDTFADSTGIYLGEFSAARANLRPEDLGPTAEFCGHVETGFGQLEDRTEAAR